MIGAQKRSEGGGNIHRVQSPTSNELPHSAGSTNTSQTEQPDVWATGIQQASNDAGVQNQNQHNANTVNTGRRDTELLSLHLEEAYSSHLWQHLFL